ncbi:hypothetical protein [Cellulomonas fengjieae]|uniref:Uncharacterized protein n=1 Tax=Cellulomonas fengjieae TaxID=2819978 RepID=A0ABS3SGJ1_9CELL|nr:hypothetical protein [Cellulomonas fengjieae]MBO3084863.1 hypothetical protein [Cellulomonas fengjieae]QVI66823.1 hypothetical protein KG102_04340 [Cellulomonas fengjieae]
MDGDDLDLDGATRVERTGIALVHEGELVVPAPGAAADLVTARGADGEGPTEVHYWFPVQIEVVGLDDATAGTVVARVFDELGRELGARG